MLIGDEMETIGFVGAGNMAEAIIQGILAAGLFIALMVFVVAILGTMGVITLIGGFVLLIMLKWGWLWLLK